MSYQRLSYVIWVLLTLLALVCCTPGSQSFEVTPADEPQTGPGLFSGPDGTFTIYQKDFKKGSPEQ